MIRPYSSRLLQHRIEWERESVLFCSLFDVTGRVGENATKEGVRHSTIWAFVFLGGDLLCL
jgi:hypothetical protein